MKAVRAFIALSVLCAICGSVYLLAQTKSEDAVEKTAMLMGSFTEIKVPLTDGLSRAAAEKAIEDAFEEIRRIERLFSLYLPDSEISKINRLKKGEPLKVSSDVLHLIDVAVGFCTITNGAFDITVKPLVDLWAEAKKTGVLPGDETIKAAVSMTGCKDIIIDTAAGTIAFSRDGMAIDTNAIVEGYAIDRAVAVLKSHGVKNALVNCGGDMYCLGRKSRHEQWKVGIRHPRDSEKVLLELMLEDKAVCTSGDYEKYFIIGGKRYAHIIDPRTGYPIGDNVMSASVIADRAVTADALATSMCVLGPGGLSVLDSIGDSAGAVEAIMVFNQDGKQKIEMTNGTKDRHHVTETR